MKNNDEDRKMKQLLWTIIVGIFFIITIVITAVYQFQGVFTKGESLIADLLIIGFCWISTRLSLIEDTVEEIEKRSSWTKVIRRVETQNEHKTWDEYCDCMDKEWIEFHRKMREKYGKDDREG